MRGLWSLIVVLAACDGGKSPDADDTELADTEAGDTEPTTDTEVEASGQRTLANCGGSVGAGVPSFYTTYFDCVDVEVDGSGLALGSEGLPPHPTPYYDEEDPNWVEFDTRGGEYRQNPNTLGAQDFSMTVPDAPVAKGLTISAALVDNTMNTSDEEFSGGPIGLGLNGVLLFAAMAAPGDVLADEEFTFDLYGGHPAGTQYHYHGATQGPLEVLVDRSLSSSAVPGEGEVELYGVLCDGTVVLGCTELDGVAPDDADFDAQNGHVHDLSDGTTTHFTARYHTHVCPALWPAYPYFPEIAYYETTGCPSGRP